MFNEYLRAQIINTDLTILTDEWITQKESDIYRLAELIRKVGLGHDPEGYGYLAFEEDGAGRAPRFGEPMEEAIRSIEPFVRRHYGNNPEQFNHPVIISGSGIGGQTTCVVPALGFVVKHSNRRLYVCDSLGTNYQALEEEWLSALRNHPNTKLLWVVGSKSGGTDETMVNFQMNLKTMIRIWARFFHSDAQGGPIAQDLIAKLFDNKALFEKKIKDLNLTPEQLRILQTVFNNLVIVTGSKESGSRLAKLIEEAFLNELFDRQEDQVVSILMLGNLGGRFQGISPNAFIYNVLLGLDIKAMLKAARQEAAQQRNDPSYRTKRIARDLWSKKVKHLLIAMPNDIIFGRLAEALGQMVPESLGKGRRDGKPLGIQTYAYDRDNINTAFQDIQPKDKAYLILDVKGEEPIKLNDAIAAGNMIIRYELEEVSEAELAKLIQFLEDITAHYGMLNTAKALLEAPATDGNSQKIDLFNEANIAQVMQGADKNNKKGDPFNGFRTIFDETTPFRQPDVEFAKKLVSGKKDEAGQGILKFNEDNKTDGGLPSLPLRNQEERESAYTKDNETVSRGACVDLSTLGLRDDVGVYRTGPEAAGILSNIVSKMGYQARAPTATNHRHEIIALLNALQSLQQTIIKSGIPLKSYQQIQQLKEARNELFRRIQELASLTSLTAQEELTAKQLTGLLLNSHKNRKSFNFVFYEDRFALTEILKRFVEFSGFDRFDFGPAEQHKSFQLTSGGIDVSTEVLVQSVKAHEKVKRTEELICYDGCVPKYLHGLYPSEVGTLYLRAYAARFKDKQVETEAVVMMTKDATEVGNVADLMILFTRMLEIYTAAKLPESCLTVKLRTMPDPATVIADATVGARPKGEVSSGQEDDGRAEASLIDLNQADLEALRGQLKNVPGLSKGVIKGIIEWRQKNGSFANEQQLFEVGGLKQHLWQQVGGRFKPMGSPLPPLEVPVYLVLGRHLTCRDGRLKVEEILQVTRTLEQDRPIVIWIEHAQPAAMPDNLEELQALSFRAGKGAVDWREELSKEDIKTELRALLEREKTPPYPHPKI